MDLGVVLQTNPPAARVVELARQAELHGFTHVWTFDSHILWQEPFVIYSQILAATRRVVVGPMVTNPATRDWTVTASLFATLNDMFGNRTICGIGRGDSAVRVANGRPTSLATLRDCIEVVRELANGREAEHHGTVLRFPWGDASRLEVWVAAYGPQALALAGEVGDGFILQLADPDIAAWTIKAVRDAAEAAGRDPAGVRICVAAPAYVGDDLAHQRDQCRWFGGMVGNHVADLVARYGSDGGVPAALTRYIEGRQGYDYNEHGRAGNTHTSFVPDDVVDRFCVLGPPERHVERLQELRALGVDQFAVYLQHDAKEETLRAYGETVMEHVRDTHRARRVKARLRRAALFVLAILVLVGLWEGYKALAEATGGEVLGWELPARSDDRSMPHVADILSRLGDPEARGADRTVGEVVLSAAWYSFRVAMVGFLAGVVVGMGLAIAMARSRLLERGLLPYIVLSQTVPLVALAPLVVGWGGRLSLLGWDWEPWASVAVIAAYLAFFPVAVGALRGLQSPPPQAFELMASCAASPRETLVKLQLPASLPHLVPALKLAAAAAVVGTVVAEISTGTRGGIGRLIIEYSRQATSDPTKVYTAILGAALLGLAVAGLVALLDLLVSRHRPKAAA